MRFWFLSVLALTVLLAGCMTAEQRRAADEERCRNYGFKKRNDAFAECMQRLDLARRARLQGQAYIDGAYGRTMIIE